MTSPTLYQKLTSDDNLYSAWLKVAGNMGAGGIDRVSIEDFESGLYDNLNIIKGLLEKGDYDFLPLLRFEIDKPSGGKRTLGIPTIRDRIVQQAIVNVLEPLFESEFLDCSYAYRPRCSAHQALHRIEQYIKQGCQWILDADIQSFFDTVNHTVLLELITAKINDTQMISLIDNLLMSGAISKGMSIAHGAVALRYNRHRQECLCHGGIGIPQGAVTSPLFANIYFHQFDKKMRASHFKLVRYADDFVILTKTQREAEDALKFAADALCELQLKLNETKTRICSLPEGFVFLGYQFTTKGKFPCQNAIERLKDKINKELSQVNPSKERLKSIIQGWKGYFKLDIEHYSDLIKELERILKTEPDSIPAHLAMAASCLDAGEVKKAYEIVSNRSSLPSANDPEIYYQWGVLCHELNMNDEAVNEFSNALRLNPQDVNATYSLGLFYLHQKRIDTAIRYLQRATQLDPASASAHYALGQAFEEWGLHGAAGKAFKRAFDLDPNLKTDAHEKKITLASGQHFSHEDITLLLSLFAGREGVHAKQWVDSSGKSGYLPVKTPIGEKEIRTHLSGESTLGIYLMRADNTVKSMVIDVDINKKMLVKYSADEGMMKTLDEMTQEEANKINLFCSRSGINVYIEDSGCKGRHCWFFFEKPIRACDVREFGMAMMKKIGEPPEGIHRELFPVQNMVSKDAFGCLIKLPLGIHRMTQRQCLFVDSHGLPYTNQAEFVRGIRLITMEDVKNALEEKKQELIKEEPADELIQRVINGCPVLRFLVSKAKETKDLRHTERLVLLYTLGHLGNKGKQYIHYVIGHCSNYDFHRTSRWFNRIPAAPVSCPRIREWLSDITPGVGCYCEFNLPKGGYPSPLLYANSEATKQMAMKKELPIISQKPVDVPARIALPQEPVDEIVKKYMEIKRHKRKVDMEVQECEDRLNSLLDTKGMDSILTEFGRLVRTRREDKTTFAIEI